MRKSPLLLLILVLFLPAALTAGTTISQGGTCGFCYGNECSDPILPLVGSCNCRISRLGICVESGSGCLTGWFCEDTGTPPPNAVEPGDDGVSAFASVGLPSSFPPFFSELGGGDGYAVSGRDGVAVLQVTYGGITYVSVANDGGVEDYATMPGRSGYERISPAAAGCLVPAASGGSAQHRVYMYCAYGLPTTPPRGKMMMPRDASRHQR